MVFAILSGNGLPPDICMAHALIKHKHCPTFNEVTLKWSFNYLLHLKQQPPPTCCCHLPLFATPWTVVPSWSSVHGLSQARILEWVGISFSRGSFLTQGWNPRLLHWLAGRFFTTEPPGKPVPPTSDHQIPTSHYFFSWPLSSQSSISSMKAGIFLTTE